MGLDVFFGILLLIAGWRAYRQGFARQLIQLTGLALGVCFAEPVAAKLAPLAVKHVPDVPAPIQGPSLVLLALFVIWLAVSVSGSFVLASYRKRVYGDNSPSLGDSLFGLGIGAVKAAFVISLMVFGFDRLPESVRLIGPIEEQTRTSKGVHYAHEFRLIDRLIGTREVQAIGKRVQELVEFLRNSPDAKPAEGANPDPKSAPSPPPLAGRPDEAMR
ncbi:MAG TPA: CvpA family protein [Planctomycetia bacterium]|nr:CvpA family protein [Planctomycetia bacterium]